MGLLDSLPDEKGGMLDSLPDEPVARVEKPKRSLVGEFGAGLAQGALQLPQMVGGVTKLAGDAIGSETVSALGKDAINYWGNKLKPYEAEAPSFTDIEDAGDAAKYVAHGIGALVPTVAASVVSGGIGAGLAKEGGKRAIAKEIVKRELKHEAVDLMAKGAVKETVKKAVTRGAIAGAGAASYGMEAGSIYADQAEQGIEKPFKAALTAVPAAALDVIPELRILSKIPAFKVLQEIPFFKTAEGRNALVRGGKEALKQGGAEGVTEFAQTLIERYGADKEAFSKEGLLEAANAGILGGIGGGMMGGVAGSVQKPATDTNLLKEDTEESSDIAKELLRVRNQPAQTASVPQPETVAQPEAYEGPVMDAEAPTPEDLELQSMQRENENYRQQQLMDRQDIPTVEEKPVPQVPSSFKTADGKVTVKTKAVGEGVFQVETTNIDEYGHKKTFVQEMNAEDAVKHIDNVTPPVTRDQYLQVKGANDEAMSEVQTSNAEGNQSLPELQNAGSVNDSSETGGVVRPVGEGEKPGGAVSDTAASALPTGESGGMLSEGSTVETTSQKESKASDEASKTAPKVVIKSLSDLPPGQHEIKGAGTFLVDDKGRVKILRGTKLESVDPMRRKLAIDKYNGMVLAEKQKANREALKVGKTKQKELAEEARGIAEDDAPYLRAALQNVKDADFGKISVDGNQAEATWSTFGALIPYIRGTGFSKADAVKIMAEAVETGKLPPEKNKAERSLVESALKHEKKRIEEAENRVETEDERLLKAEREAIENEGGDTSFEFSQLDGITISGGMTDSGDIKLVAKNEKGEVVGDAMAGQYWKGVFVPDSVGVEEPYRRKGLASKLYDSFKDYLPEGAALDFRRADVLTQDGKSFRDSYDEKRGYSKSLITHDMTAEAYQSEPKPLMEGDQSKLFPTPPTFGKKPQGTGAVAETPMLTEMKEREAESKQTSMTLDMLGMQQIYESLTDGVMKEHATTALDKVRNTLDNPGGLGTLGNWKQYLAKRYKTLGMLSGIKDFTHQITKTFGKASENDRKAIFEFLTDKQGDASTISPALREESIKMKQMIEDIGDKLVAYGLIPQDVMDANRGAYLPTVYLKHILGKEGFQAMGSGKKLDLTYTKKKYLRKSLKEQGLTEEEIDLFMRTQMGEIKDPAYLLARAFSIPSRDMAIIDWLAEIATHSEWVLPKSLIEWTHSENPVRRSGRVEYKKNADGSFDLKIHKTKMVETKHTVTSSALGKLLGSDKIADYIKAGKGKQQTRKDEVKGKVVYKATPWKKVGHIQYKLNPDGTFTLKIKEKVTSVDELSGVKDLKGLVGEKKADQILNDEGKALGGRKVTPFWLAAEAKRIREMIPHLPEADRAEAKEVADRMQRLSDEADVSGKLPDDYRQMPDSAKYGALRGLVVRKEIYSDLVGNINISIGEKSLPEEWLGTGGKITKLTGMWKWPLALDTPLPTPSGWTTMGEVKIGDKLFDEQGEACEVLAVKEVLYEEECFEVVFSDGTKITADKDHRWMVFNSVRAQKILTTEQIKNTLVTGPRGDRRHSIPVTEALDLPAVNLPIPPYVLGAWLGDGDAASARICAGKDDADEMIRHLENSGVRCSGGTVRKDGLRVFSLLKASTRCLRGHDPKEVRPKNKGCKACEQERKRNNLSPIINPGLPVIMQNLGVLNNKHIPIIYLRASKEQRLELLRGLMDTDGYTVRNNCSISTSIPRLRDDVVELLRTLGYKPLARAYQPINRATGKTGKTAWKIQFSAYSDQPVFHLKRKQDRLTPPHGTRQRSQTRQIIAVNPVTSVPVRCISVSSPSELFLAGSGFIPTHNSKVAANPPAQVRNFVSNLVLLNLSGIPVYRVPIRMAQAVKEIRSNGKHWQVAKKYGVKEATFSNTELARIETALIDLEARSNGKMSWAQIKSFGAKLVNLTGDAYQFMEAMGKTAKIIDEMENGKSGQEAAMEAHKWLFDYSLVSPGVKYLRNAPIGIPFITFMTKVLPRLTEVAVTKPWRFTPYVAIAYGMQAAVAGMLDVDDDDLDKLREALPEWIREKQHVYFLPYKDDAGRWQVVDLGYFFPWTQWTTFVEDVGEGDLWKAMRGSGILGGPLPDLIVALKTNVDPFTQRPIIDKYADPSEKAAQMFGYLYQMAMPPWLTQRGTAGKLYSALSENVDKFGLPKATVKQAGLSMAGINLSGFDPALTRGQNLKRMDFEISEVQRQAKSELQNKNLSDSEIEEIREKFKKRIQKMNLKKMKYAANSMPKNESLLQRR